MHKVTVVGAAGRMGRAIVRCASQATEFTVVGACEHDGCPALGADAGTIAGIQKIGVDVTSDLSAAVVPADVVIDFSFHEAAPRNIHTAAELGKPVVIGTTGLTSVESKAVEGAAKDIAVVYAPNMSLGVNVLLSLVRTAAEALGPSYDIEIAETHHKHKKDAPSGTALRLARVAAESREQNPEAVTVYGRKGQTGERPEGQIGIHAMRMGDIVGDHTVTFAVEGERLDLSHRATSRDTFAIGAVRAAGWVVGRVPGLYNMADVLGL